LLCKQGVAGSNPVVSTHSIGSVRRTPARDGTFALVCLPGMTYRHMRFERPNVYALSLTAPLDRIRFKGPVPRGLRELRRPREAVEAWDVLEASFYPAGIADVRLVRRERTKDGFEKIERHWIETVTAGDLSRGLHPERAVAPLIVSLGNDELAGPAAELAVWSVFERLVLRSGNRRLRSLLSEDHWLIL